MSGVKNATTAGGRHARAKIKMYPEPMKRSAIPKRIAKQIQIRNEVKGCSPLVIVMIFGVREGQRNV